MQTDWQTFPPASAVSHNGDVADSWRRILRHVVNVILWLGDAPDEGREQ
jgi:hypothetical protein